MKKILLYTLLFPAVYWGQTNGEQSTISSAGEQVVGASGNQYSFNVGGLVIETKNGSSGNVYTQDFVQPLETIILDDFNPNTAFSPNGDGINDFFELPLPTQVIADNLVVIFNRWGDEVARYTNYNNIDSAWDGTFSSSGENVPEGTYFFIIESVSNSFRESGWIQVTR